MIDLVGMCSVWTDLVKSLSFRWDNPNGITYSLGALPVKLPFSFGNHEEGSLHVKIKSLLIGIDMIGSVRVETYKDKIRLNSMN